MSVQIFQPGFMPRPWAATKDRVQRSHRSLWDGLIIAAPWWEAGPPVDLISGRRFRWESTIGGFRMSEAGRGMVNTTNLEIAKLPLPANINGTPWPMTIAWYGWGTGSAMFNFAHLFGIIYNGTPDFPFFVINFAARAGGDIRLTGNRGSGTREDGISTGINIGTSFTRPTLMVGTLTEGGLYHWIDNVNVASDGARAAGGPAYTATSHVRFGTWNVEQVEGIHLVGYIWNRELTETERTLLWQDPFGVIRPDPHVWMSMNLKAPAFIGDPNIYAPMPVFFS